MANDSISVIVAAYNAENTINKCIVSLLNQINIGLYKIVIVNDGSTDKTLEKIKKYQFNSKITIINKSNTGASDSRNVALRQINTEYVTFVDADDYVDNDYLHTLLEQYIQNPDCDLAICGYQKELTNGKVTLIGRGKKSILDQERAFHDIFISYNFEGYLVNKLFRMSIIKTNYLWIDKNVTLSEDLLFCCEYLRHCKKISFNPKPVYHYVYYADSQLHSHQIGGQFKKSAISILDTFSKIRSTVPSQYIKVISDVNARTCWFAVALLRSIEAAPNRKDVDKQIIQNLREVAKKYRNDFMKNDVLPPRDKIIYWVNWFFPKTLGKIWNLLRLHDHS